MRIEGFRERLQTEKSEILMNRNVGLSNSEASALAASNVLDEIELDLIESQTGSENNPIYDEIDRRQTLIIGAQVFRKANEKIMGEEEDRLDGIVGLTDELYGGLK